MSAAVAKIRTRFSSLFKKKVPKRPVDPPQTPDIVLVRHLERDHLGRIHTVDNSELDPDDVHHFYSLAEQFEKNDIKIESIQYIVNERLSEIYEGQKTEFIKQGILSKEVVTFHATTTASANLILKEGFKMGGVDGHRIRHGQIFGQGVYTSTDVSNILEFSHGNTIVALKGLVDIEQHTKMTGTWIIFRSPRQTLPLFILHFISDKRKRFLPLVHPSSYRFATDISHTAEEDLAIDYVVSQLSSKLSKPQTVQRVLKNLLQIQLASTFEERSWQIDTDTLEAIDCWTIYVGNFDKKLPLAKDLSKYQILQDKIQLEFTFPIDFPQAPPFVRIVSPRLMRFMNGGGGHVTVGGSICLELLTTSGWRPETCIEGLIHVIRLLLSEKSRPARLDPKRWDIPYTMAEAKESFTRVASQHGWI